MKLQIDTEKKTIKVEGTVNFDALIKNLKKLFPENEWKEYSLESNTTITYWTNPIVYPIYQPYYYDWRYPTVLCGTGIGVLNTNTLTTSNPISTITTASTPYTLTSETTTDTIKFESNIYNIEFSN